MNRRNPIQYFLAACLTGAMLLMQPALGQEESQSERDQMHEAFHEEHELEEVRVTATPLASDALEMTQSATVLSGEALDRELSSSLGETLKNMPGLSSASFGANVGRPIIRGMDASRVGVMENNLSSNDASKVSQDHAVAIEPFLADQIEVLRGPATLLYGSDSIGGVVNVRTNRTPQEPPEGLSGRVLIQGDTVADQRYGAARIDGGTPAFGFHADAFYRDTDDYEIPGFAEVDPEPGEQAPGKLANSALQNQGGALGATWFGDVWQAGLAVSAYESEYGIPGEGHHHEEEEEHEEEEAEFVSIDLKSTRIDGEIQARNPWRGVEQFKLLLNNTDYEHTEIEGAEVGTVFQSDTTEGRVELTHEAIGDWRGVVGLQYGDQDFSALGEEAFVPPSTTEGLGLFWLEEAEFETLRLELGIRYEDIDTRTDDGRSANHSPFSASAGAIWHLDDETHLAFNFARAQRAPGDEELFAFGPHVATQVFEIGDPDLATETSKAFEASYKKHAGRFSISFTGYYNDFDNFIYLADTGLEEDELPVRMWTQQGAEFTGGEAELRFDIGHFDSGHWEAWAFADAVRAELDDGSKVPRIPPHRIGAGLDWHLARWSAALDWIHAAEQDRLADNETPTAGYDDVGFDVSYELPGRGDIEWDVFLRGRNLLDEEIRNHSSFLKDQAPQAGRNFMLGLRVSF